MDALFADNLLQSQARISLLVGMMIAILITLTTDAVSSAVPTAKPMVAVTSTPNPLVALYSVTTSRKATVQVEFGRDTSYRFHTSAVSTAANGGQVSILVAGMKPSTRYHMRAIVRYENGTRWFAADHVFTTGKLNQALLPDVQVSGTTRAPSPGIEMLTLIYNGSGPSNQFQVAAEDLQGQLIWYYNDPAIQPPYVPNPVKLLSDGSILINYSQDTSSGVGSILRDIDLAGNIQWQMTAQGLAQALAAKNCFTGSTVIGSSHDVTELPNGHLVLIVNLQESFTNLPGYLGTIVVAGDGLVDLDQNRNPAWCWSTFDHLDINRHPWNFPDWTHTNAVLYSPSDGNLIISMRSQNWLIKINYQDGAGDGSVVWHLGYQGDFALEGGTAPVDWFYAQHGPSIISDDGKGDVTLGVLDNGNDRVVDAAGDVCGTTGQIPCLSRAAVYQLDENTATATLSFQDELPYLSFFGGNVEQLANLDLEFDAAAATPSGATIQELSKHKEHHVVWQLQVQGQFAYRGYRLPSLYPGVQW